MNVGFVSADMGGSAFYRIIQPYMISKEHYDNVFFNPAGKVTYKLVDNSDVLIIQRQEAKSAIAGMLEQKKRGKIILTDIDDNIWAIPQGVVDLKAFWTKDKIERFETTLKICDAVTTSTSFLAKVMQKFNPNVYVLPNLINSFEYTKLENRTIRIGWGGSPTHLPDFTPTITSTLLKLKEEYGDLIELVIVGITPLELIGKSTFYRFTTPHKYLRFLRELNFDIGIIPCNDNFFNDARSNIKYLEWSAIKAATVTSPARSYVDCIKHGVTGFIARKPKQWYEYLKLLIEDKNLRIKVSQNAFNYVHENYSVEKKRSQYKLYGEIFERKNNANNLNSDTSKTETRQHQEDAN